MTPDPIHDLAVRYTAAWCSQDPSAVAAHFAPGGSLTINGGTPAVGRAAITEDVRSFMIAFPDLQVLMDGLEVEAGRAIYRWTLTGTSDGRAVRISGFEEWTISDGLIAESQGHFDAAEYNRQLKG